MGKEFKIPFDDDNRVIDTDEILARDGEIWEKTVERLTYCILAHFTTMGEFGSIAVAVHNIKDDVERIATVIFENGYPYYSRLDRDWNAEPPGKLRRAPAFKRGSIPTELRWAVFERDDFRCQRCGTRRDLCADHKHPESKGGETTLENLETLCRACNSRKGNRVEVQSEG